MPTKPPSEGLVHISITLGEVMQKTWEKQYGAMVGGTGSGHGDGTVATSGVVSNLDGSGLFQKRTSVKTEEK